MHDYQLEYAYLALSEKKYESSIIRYLLSQSDPLKKLTDFNRGRKYLVPEKEEEDNRYKVKEIKMLQPLDKEKKYKWKLRRRTMYYFIISFMGFAPFIVFPNILDFSLSTIIMMVVWVVAFLMISLYFLIDIIALESAKRISKLKQKENKC